MSSKKPDPKDIEVGHRVRAIRLEKGMSQEKLGDALDLTFQQVQKYEKGTNRIGAGRLQHIAEILGVPVADLFAPAAERTLGPRAFSSWPIRAVHCGFCAPIRRFRARSSSRA